MHSRNDLTQRTQIKLTPRGMLILLDRMLGELALRNKPLRWSRGVRNQSVIRLRLSIVLGCVSKGSLCTGLR